MILKPQISINYQLIFFILGAVMEVEGFFMCVPGIVSVFYGESDYHVYLLTAAFLIMGGALTIFACRNRKSTMSRQDSYIVVLLMWIIFALFGLIPYLWGGHLSTFSDAFFESVSGITTTGATLMPNLEQSSHGILLWRSLTQWLGGMGIITLSLILLPAMGVGGMQLFNAEASVTRSDKIHPKITEMAKYIWVIYIALTLLQTLLLKLGGMDWFDAVCHSLSTLSTGGFSTKSDSVEFFNSPFIEYVFIIFMFLGGVNFVLFYSIILGKAKRLVADEELKYYTSVAVFISLLVAAVLLYKGCYTDAEEAFRDSAFHVVAFMTSSGFTTSNYMLWPAGTITILAFLMLTGTCTGSTSGGIKFMRIIIMFRNIKNEIKRTLHPTAIVSVKYNGKAVPNGELQNIMMFILLYIVILGTGIMLISLGGNDFEDSFGLAASSLGNIGITVGTYGYTAPLSNLAPIVKYTMTILMIIGRLEIYTAILIFSPSFWKR